MKQPVQSSTLYVFVLLGLMAVLMIGSMKDDAVTMDEVAHLPAGYSYLAQQDIRLNPEHPPLLKDLAALPLLFMDTRFPADIRAWKEETNGQWDFGFSFLYDHGNPVDQMIFWARIPMIALTMFLGWFIWKWTKEQWGEWPALGALGLFVFSPTILSHGRLVTTDVGAAFGVVISTYFFLRFLRDPSLANVIVAGITLGIAQLLKFSLILLFPFFAILLFCWVFCHTKTLTQFFNRSLLFILRSLAITLIVITLIVVVYQFHVFHYPPERQAKDIEYILPSHQWKQWSLLLTSFAKSDFLSLRAASQYLLGISMVLNRTASGNTTYFLGEVSNRGWTYYFPIVYLIKEPIPFHVASFSAVILLIVFLRKGFRFIFTRESFAKNFTIVAMLFWIGLYWLTSIASPLNIGVRHLLPVFPFTFILIGSIFRYIETMPYRKFFIGGTILLFAWQIISVASQYPHFLAYFNEFVGGPAQGYRYVVDSNLDWGQDLRRLAKWADENDINKIKVAYFGGGKPEFYLKEKFEPFEWGIPAKGWVAVSATPLMIGMGTPVKGFDQPTGFFRWLEPYTPVTTIGYSIFIYHIEQETPR